jgi:acetylglutamate kinase
MERTGLKAQFVQGQRVTDEATAEIVDRVLSREINPEVVSAIKSFGGAAEGLSGPSIFKCRKARVEGPDGQQLDLGFVGEVTEVNTAPLLECIARGVTPVISPTARGDDGKIYNCNADVAAAQTAIALNARRLVFMSDVPGLLRNPKDPASVMSHLKISEVDQLRSAGVVDKGMIPKITSAVQAITAGVEKVSLVDGRIPHAVLLEIFTDAGVGTEVVRD